MTYCPGTRVFQRALATPCPSGVTTATGWPSTLNSTAGNAPLPSDEIRVKYNCLAYYSEGRQEVRRAIWTFPACLAAGGLWLLDGATGAGLEVPLALDALAGVTDDAGLVGDGAGVNAVGGREAAGDSAARNDPTAPGAAGAEPDRGARTAAAVPVSVSSSSAKYHRMVTLSVCGGEHPS